VGGGVGVGDGGISVDAGGIAVDGGGIGVDDGRVGGTVGGTVGVGGGGTGGSGHVCRVCRQWPAQLAPGNWVQFVHAVWLPGHAPPAFCTLWCSATQSTVSAITSAWSSTPIK
jgi:hypothetical protein